MKRRTKASADTETVAEKISTVMRAPRPRLGRGRSSDGRRAAEVAAEPIAKPPR